jgi:hypothetical protein
MTEPADKMLEKELLGLERQYWQSIKDNQPDTMSRLSADPCVVAGAQGIGLLDHATLRKMAGSAAWKLEAFELSKPIVRTIAPDVAVVAYQVQETLTVDGKSVTLDAADLSTWVRRDGRWTCAAHTESLKGDPFGRDRQTPST